MPTQQADHKIGQLSIAFEMLSPWKMKEEIRQIYQGCRTFRGAERKFEKWIRIGGILYQSSASMIQKHLPGICNYFENHTTNGLIEGINTKITELPPYIYTIIAENPYPSMDAPLNIS